MAEQEPEVVVANDPLVHRPPAEKLTRTQMIQQILAWMNAVEEESPVVLAGLILDYCADQFGVAHPVDPPAADPPVHRPPNFDPPVHRPE